MAITEAAIHKMANMRPGSVLMIFTQRV
jgi:hypothetical protein